MILNYITAAFVLMFFIVSLAAVISEKTDIKSAAIRNSLRCVRVSLREITGFPAVITAVVLLIILPEDNKIHTIWTLASVSVFLLTTAVLSVCLKIKKSSRKKKKAVIVPSVKFSKTAGITETSDISDNFH